MQTNEKRPSNRAPLTAGEATTSVNPNGDTSHGLPVYPVVFESAYEPADGMSRWWGTYLCPRCGGGRRVTGGTLADLSGVKRTRCGHGRIWLVVARVYPVHEVKAVPDAAA